MDWYLASQLDWDTVGLFFFLFCWTPRNAIHTKECTKLSGTSIGILDLNNRSNTNFKKMIFRVKVLTFRFGCSPTLNSKCWRIKLISSEVSYTHNLPPDGSSLILAHFRWRKRESKRYDSLSFWRYRRQLYRNTLIPK